MYIIIVLKTCFFLFFLCFFISFYLFVVQLQIETLQQQQRRLAKSEENRMRKKNAFEIIKIKYANQSVCNGR